MGMRLLGPVYLVGGQDYNMVYLDWPANDCNSYLLDTGDTLVMMDCGCGESLPGILHNVKEMGFAPWDISDLFLTHAHWPHAGAAEEMRRNGVRVRGSAATVETIRNGGLATAAYHYHRRFIRVERAEPLAPMEVVTIGRCQIKAIPLPGHSADSTGYEVVLEGRRMFFCGDTVRNPHLPQYRNRPGYDKASYIETLTRLLEDPPEILYPGHGPFCLSKGEHWIAEELKKLLATPG